MNPSDRLCPIKRQRRPASLSPELVRRDGALCVTFINTASARRQEIENYDDLLAWGLEHGALNDDDVPLLMRATVERRDAVADVVRRAQTLRASVERLLLDLADGRVEEGEAIDALNAELSAQHASRTLVRHGIGVRWGWIEPGAEGRMLWPVVVSRGTRRVGLPGPGSPRRWLWRSCWRGGYARPSDQDPNPSVLSKSRFDRTLLMKENETRRVFVVSVELAGPRRIA